MARRVTRRRFLGQMGRSAGAGGVLLATGAQSHVARASIGANEKVRLGFIGFGPRGTYLLEVFRNLPDVRVMAVCDVKRSRAEAARQQAEGKPEAYVDFRRVLDRQDIDAVVIATPDHWHCLNTIYACKAGKDVYVEKPLAYTIGEGRMMVDAARKYDRIVMVGTQQRSMAHYREAVEFIQSGKLGKITAARAWNMDNLAPNGFGHPPDCDPPADLDWDLWLGPAPKAPFNPNRFAWSYWFSDYGGGWQSVWAVHMHDVTHWAMKVDHPLTVSASGGKWARDDNTDMPDTFEAVYEYPGFISTYSFRQGNANHLEGLWYGNAFYGENGTLAINREGGWKVVPELKTPNEPGSGKRMEGFEKAGTPQDPDHQRHFLESVKAHKRPQVADVEMTHHSSIPGHLANISYRTGRKLRWDPQKEQIIDDAEANKFLTRSYRKPWALEL